MGLFVPHGRSGRQNGRDLRTERGAKRAPFIMTDRLALLLGVLIAGAVVGDLILNGGQGSLFLARRFAELTEYLAFWR